MALEELLRSCLRRLLIPTDRVALQAGMPRLRRHFQQIEEFGLYLHIPFCRQICPYCPYNKTLYQPDVAHRYTQAVRQEIDLYARLVGDRPVTSCYVGGGTPTTMLRSGLEEILGHLLEAFNVQCGIHMESHPGDLSAANLRAIRALGVTDLSVGLEALQDDHLKALGRPYTAAEARAAVARARDVGFDCLNVDMMFALPGQTCQEVEASAQAMVAMGVDQVAAYPFFLFPYTRMGQGVSQENYRLATIVRRRRMLAVLEHIFYGAGFQRTSVWAFTRPGAPRYCSVTVPLYIGLGASGGSYLRDVFYLNTFHVGEYIQALAAGRLPIALVLDLSEAMQRAGWLYWRIYETRFRRTDFRRRFGCELDAVYGRYLRPWRWLGLLVDDGEEIVLTDRGAYWLHVLQDLFSVDYISRLWGTAQQDPWPRQVLL